MKRNDGNGPSRRKRVERGIYRHDSLTGVTYEVTYSDSDGRQRWKTIDGGLKEARAVRADITSKLARGERVSPSRQTFSEVAITWLALQTQLRPRTREWYEIAIRVHLTPRLGRLRIAQVNEDAITRVIAEMQASGYKAWTIRGVLTPLGRILGYAARRGLIPSNPMRRLERGERPSITRREMRILSRNEITKLLEFASAKWRTLLATAIFTGARLGEILALRWCDIGFDEGLVHVRAQLDRHGNRVEPKTPQAIRSIILIPALAKLLREHRLASPFAQEHDLVFASELGTPLNHRNAARRGLERAMERAKLDGDERPKLRFHDLRHTFASLLVAECLNVVFVSRQLGHASPDITLRVYAHLFDGAEHAQRASDQLQASFGGLL